MLPLSAESTPTTPAALTEALRQGFKDLGVEPRQLDLQGETLSQLASLRIDLSETRLTREIPAPNLNAGSDQDVDIAQFDLSGVPIYFEGAPVELRLSASGVKAGLKIADGHGWLAPVSAASGNVSVEATREALESFLHSFAVEAAKKQGFEVKKTHLDFTQEGPRAVSFRAEVTAKVFIMTAALALTGKFAIDDEFNAKLSNLALDGDGMILKLAGSYAKPHLDKLEGRTFPLMSFTAGGLRLHDVALTAGNSLRVQAKFGAA